MRVTQPVKCKSAVLPGAQWHHQATLQITAMEALQAFNNWVPPQLHSNRTSVTQQPGTHAGNQTTQSEQPIDVAGSSLQVSNIQAGRSIGALTTNQATCAADSSSPQATTPHAAHYLQASETTVMEQTNSSIPAEPRSKVGSYIRHFSGQHATRLPLAHVMLPHLSSQQQTLTPPCLSQ